jgi:hypothetical protein
MDRGHWWGHGVPHINICQEQGKERHVEKSH